VGKQDHTGHGRGLSLPKLAQLLWFLSEDHSRNSCGYMGLSESTSRNWSEAVGLDIWMCLTQQTGIQHGLYEGMITYFGVSPERSMKALIRAKLLTKAQRVHVRVILTLNLLGELDLDDHVDSE